MIIGFDRCGDENQSFIFDFTITFFAVKSYIVDRKQKRRIIDMRFNKDQLDRLISLPDAELWNEVRRLASGYGLNLPSDTPRHEEIEKLRSAVRGNKVKLSDAMRILNTYRKD